jgi:putative aldouronate transport system substrate-binding protein
MKKMCKVLSMFITFSILATLVVGCGKGASEPSSTSTAATATATAAETASTSSTPALEKVPLTIMVAGDRPKQQDLVLENINKVTENELNIDLKVNYIPWGDYINQVKLKSAAGQEFDIFLSFYSEIAGDISRKQCIPVNDLLDQYGKDLKEKISKALFDTLTVDGKIYGIPSVYAMTELNRGLIIRKDLRLKYNLPEITDIATLEQFLDTIAKNEKGMIPHLQDIGMYTVFEKSSLGHSIYSFGSDLYRYMYINQDVRPLKVENWYKTDLYKAFREENIKAYKNGWLEKDILTNTDQGGKFIAGKAAAMPGDLYNIGTRDADIKKNIPTAELELAILNKDGIWQDSQPCNNFGMISSTSKNPERAMMFMNWLLKNQENYDLYMLGIKGVTYNLVGDKAEVPAGTAPTDKFAPTPWFEMYLPYARAWTTDSQGQTDAINFWNSLKPEATPLQTFQYSKENVKAEAAAVDKVCTDMANAVSWGVLPSQADYDKFIAALDKAGIEKIIEDTQKQVDAFVAKNNIK